MMINCRLGITGALVGSLLIQLPVQEHVIHYLKKNITLSSSSLKQQTDLSEAEVCDRAEKVTIKILSENEIAEGTGILVKKKEQGKDLFIYTVLTNAHVVRESRNYQVKTNDDRFHRANLISRYDQNSSGDDLAILQFNSKSDYDVATFRSASTLERDDRVFAAGFPVVPDPSEPRGFKCKSGLISWILDREMELGYKVGYFVDIKKGMSGGPLLNSKGEVVGINGKHSHPLPFGTGNQDPYVYKDGSTVDRPRNLLENSSWAIPIEKLREKEYVSIINIDIAEAPPYKPSPLPLPEPIVAEESRQPESQDPGSPQQQASQNPGSTQQASQVPPESTEQEQVLPSELEDRGLNCSSNISILQQPRSEHMEAFLEKNNFFYVQAKLSCQDKNCSLQITRRAHVLEYFDIMVEQGIPVEDRGEVLNIQVQELDNPDKNGIVEPEVIVSLLATQKERYNCYELIYRYHVNRDNHGRNNSSYREYRRG